MKGTAIPEYSHLYRSVYAEINVHHLCFLFSVSVSLLANLPEDKLSKIVDCLEVVSYSVKLSLSLSLFFSFFFFIFSNIQEGQFDFSLYCLSGLRNPFWKLMGAPALQIAAVKISLPFGHIPLLHVSIFSLPPVGKTSQITLLMNRADIIPVIARRCILLP